MTRFRTTFLRLTTFAFLAAGLFGIPASSVLAQASPTADADGPTLAQLPAATPRSQGPLVVVATTPLLADLASQIGGDRTSVTSLLPPSADPHDFEPTPRDIVMIEEADMVIEHGLQLDDWASELVANSGTTAPVVIATKGIQTIATDEEGFPDGDPHVWFDPRNVATMANTIADALAAVDPDGAESYASRATAYSAQIDALDKWIAERIASIPPERRKLVTNHDAFGYLIERYGLTFVGAVIPSLDSRAEPSAKETADLIERIRAEGVPAIFTESTINPLLEESLAAEAGVAIVPNLYGDNLGDRGSGAETYIGMMIFDTNLIVEALR